MKIQKGDKVKVISGKEKGKIGTVLRLYVKDDRVLIEGINKVKKHVKPGAVSKEGGIISIERPLPVSNVMYYDEKLGRPVKLGSKVVEGKKYRVNKKNGEVIGK